MKITEAQASAVERLRTGGYQPGAVIDIGALFAANTRLDVGMRRALRNLAEQGKGFRQQGARGLYIVLPELYQALDEHDARLRK